MITLYSYPGLYGLEDNNPYGLKIYAFLKLCRLPFDHRHTLDVQSAPRGQLPYIADGDLRIGDSDAIIAHLKRQYELTIDDSLTPEQQRQDLLVRRALDDLYWVMSYSRWRDDRYWPIFRKALLDAHPDVKPEQLEAARQYNFQRYHYQGIGRYAPEDAYAAGSPTWRPSPACWATTASCSAPIRAAWTRGSMAFSPISISTPSIPRSSSAWCRGATW